MGSRVWWFDGSPIWVVAKGPGGSGYEGRIDLSGEGCLRCYQQSLPLPSSPSPYFVYVELVIEGRGGGTVEVKMACATTSLLALPTCSEGRGWW